VIDIRAAVERWRMRRIVRRLNDHAVFFGFGPMTEAEWLAGCERASKMIHLAGVSAAEAHAGFIRAAAILKAAEQTD